MKTVFGVKGLALDEYAISANAILGIRDSGKALALDTPIPTPSGWTTMGALKIGDMVFDESGQPTIVTYATRPMVGHDCFHIRFSDGSDIVADADHLWLTETYASRTADRNAAVKNAKQRGRGGRPQCERQAFPGLVTTRQISRSLIAGGGSYQEHNHSVRNTCALLLPPANLPVDPYVLGCWLGDGTARSATITTADAEMLEEIGAAGYRIGAGFNRSPSGRSATYRVQDGPNGKLHTQLRLMGMLNNKSVPAAYLRGSIQQRRDLLAGLMDTDGTVQRGSNSCVFYNMNTNIADAVYELVCSLGWKATRRLKRSMLKGVYYGDCHEIRFRPDQQIFRLSRKADLLDFDVGQAQRRARRVIIGADPILSVPVRCIRVSSPSHLFLCGRAMIPTHNTYTATKAAEEMFDAGIPFIALDPIGVWHSLRVPGAGKGYPVVVAGGRHGDLPLTVKNAGEIVRAAMKAGICLVVDLFSTELSKADWRRIVRETVEILLYENHDFGLRHVFIEESAEFVPQRVTDGAVFSAVEKLVRMGGNSKLGCTLINQRSEDLNKSVLELCAHVFLHRQRGKNSLANMRKWLDLVDPATAKKVMDSVPDLKSGECWLLSTDLKEPVRIKVPQKNSLHPDRRAAAGSTERGVQPTEVSKFVQDMRAALAPKPKSEPVGVNIKMTPGTVAINTSEIDRLLLDAYDRGIDDGRKIERQEIEAKMPDSVIGEIKVSIDNTIHRLAAGIEADIAKAIRKYLEGLWSKNVARPPNGPKTAQRLPYEVVARPAKPQPVPRAANGSGQLKGSLQRALDAVAWWEAVGKSPVERERAAVVAGLSPRASTFGVYIADLATQGLIEVTPGCVALTVQGRHHANFPDMATKDDIRATARGLLSRQEQKVFDVIYDSYPDEVARKEIARELGLSETASTTGVYIAAVAAYGIVEASSPGHVRAAEWMFPK